jgi:hypothetical protein
MSNCFDYGVGRMRDQSSLECVAGDAPASLISLTAYFSHFFFNISFIYFFNEIL